MAATTPRLRGAEFWKHICNAPKHILAPMVEGSELPWRLLSRQYGAQLTYSPMFHAANFATSRKYRQQQLTTCSQDRPFFVQFCGNDPNTILAAAKFVEDVCDAVDINLGCPQNVAKRGHYGCFLQDEWELIASIVKTLNENLAIPVTCKVRVFSDVQKTIAYAKMLESAGCSILTVHGRLREQKGSNTGLADWEQIKIVKQSVSIPVIANGNILYFENIQSSLQFTQADAVMSAEGNLYNPAVFNGTYPYVWEMATNYLNLCKQYPVGLGVIKGHLFKILHLALAQHLDFRALVGDFKSVDEGLSVIENLKAAIMSQENFAKTDELFSPKATNSEWQTQGDSSIYRTLDNSRHIPYWRCQPRIRRPPTEEEAIIFAKKDARTSAGLAAKRQSEQAHQEAKKARLEESGLEGESN